jgi:hypothetical protein
MNFSSPWARGTVCLALAATAFGCSNVVVSEPAGGSGGAPATTASTSTSTSMWTSTSTSITSSSTGTLVATSASASTSNGAGGDVAVCDPGAIAQDPHNCGACGHDCLGGACVAGACQPVTLVHESGQPFELAVDAANVYWLNSSGTLESVSKQGGGVSYLATKQYNPGSVAVADGTVYFGLYDAYLSVQSVPVGGGNLTALGDQGIGGGIIALDAAFVYWTEYPGGWPGAAQIMRTPRAGGPTTVLIGNLWDPRCLTVDGGYLYWSEFTDDWDVPAAPSTGGVRRVPVTGGAPEALFTGQDIASIAVDETYVYFVYEGPGSASGETSAIRRMPKGGGPITTVVSPPHGAGSIVVDASHVYWSTTIGMTLSRADKSGGPEETLAKTSNGNPYAMAQDEVAIYWVDPGNGTVMKLAK